MPPQRVAGNITVTYNSNALTAYLEQSSLEQTVNAIEVTNFGSSAQESIAGLPSFSVPVGGPWSKSLDDILGPDAISPPSTLRSLSVAIGSGANQVTYDWATGTETYGAFISDYKVEGSSPTEGLKWTGTLTVSGGPVRS